MLCRGFSSARTRKLVRVDAKMDVKPNTGQYSKETWSPDLNPIQNLWQDLKLYVHRCAQSNLTELELFSREELAKFSFSKCAKLVETYSKILAVIIVTKGGSRMYSLGVVCEYLCIQEMTALLFELLFATIKCILHLQFCIDQLIKRPFKSIWIQLVTMQNKEEIIGICIYVYRSV